ncbi:hypothetical protein J2S43_007879 [Catenuloplanes nepalensis]|uniref:Uncharacterized protein n=1 Tax=Catenuloplanes nepalensis TaxID=587533 RepID=A0ABT9N6P0_9ACTN|nr:hypothetical protein [Catenuloplanes nepalensis]MDP9799367.1 hypothetical protein [Catenuloplanes nepalensis]
MAGTAVVLGYAAATEAAWDPRTAVLLALAAVWLPQTLITADRHHRARDAVRRDRAGA